MVSDSSLKNMYTEGLERVEANYSPLTPLHFLERSATVYPERLAIVHGDRRLTWGEVYSRCRGLASALRSHGIGKGHTVAFLAPNVPAMYEAHFGVPMAGAVLNAINTRLDARTVAHILRHGQAAAVFVDSHLVPLLANAFALLAAEGRGSPPVTISLVVVIQDDDQTVQRVDGASGIGEACNYEQFLQSGDPTFAWDGPSDEWEAIALNYTSGTTSNPKGVVYHHRGAYLAAISNSINWGMSTHPVYLWSLPMFHCNGWCFPWTIAAMAGTSICLRQVSAANVFGAIKRHHVTHMCCAPVVLNTLAHADESDRQPLPPGGVAVMTAGAAPPPPVLGAAEKQGFRVTHTYGLTETYGPAVICSWKGERWDDLSLEERSQLKARQGVRYLALEGLEVMDPETMKAVPRDGKTMGEVMLRGNMVMKGYLRNPSATQSAFKGGWFSSGDLGVMHPDSYLELRDRSKDIIISGGENISSIAVESALYRHPGVLEAAVVAKPDERWGEVPCAFVTLKAGQEGLVSALDIVDFSRRELPHFMAPRAVVFAPLPKTSTGKVQKFVLRENAKKAPLLEAKHGTKHPNKLRSNL